MTPRQQNILSAVVEQYAEVAVPVGSSLLAKVFKVSSATIRAEMAELERLGFISQPYTSAGRIPTDKGYRFYVNNITDNPSVTSLPERRGEKALVSRVQSAGAPERMIRNAVDTLVELTHNLGLATIGNQLYISGLSNLFGQPEFAPGLAQNNVQQVAQLLDNLEPWLREAAQMSRLASILAPKTRLVELLAAPLLSAALVARLVTAAILVRLAQPVKVTVTL